MADKFLAFMEKDELNSDDEKRELIYEMVKSLDSEELSSVIEEMSSSYLFHELKEYMVGDSILEENSAEFRFLVQAKKNNGNVSRKEMRKEGIYPYAMQQLIDRYQLREVASGFYVFPNKPIDGPFLFQMQYTRAVISHETALYYLGLSDVIPKQTIMSMPRYYKLSQIYQAKDAVTDYRKIYRSPKGDKSGIIAEYAENDPIYAVRNHSIDTKQIILCKTVYNNPVRVTSMERSIVDVLNPSFRTEEEIKVEAIRRYFELESSKKNRLRRIAEELNLLKELDNYLWKLKLH